jgi:hypothetical protein
MCAFCIFGPSQNCGKECGNYDLPTKLEVMCFIATSAIRSGWDVLSRPDVGPVCALRFRAESDLWNALLQLR